VEIFLTKIRTMPRFYKKRMMILRTIRTKPFLWSAKSSCWDPDENNTSYLLENALSHCTEDTSIYSENVNKLAATHAQVQL